MQEIDVSKYFSWIQDGKSFDEIRKDLQIRGFSDSQIATILATLNDWVLQSNFERERRNSNQLEMGWMDFDWYLCAFKCLFVLGKCLHLYNFFNWRNH